MQGRESMYLHTTRSTGDVGGISLRKALCGGIPSSFLEPSPRSWSHFVGVYLQKLTTSLKN